MLRKFPTAPRHRCGHENFSSVPFRLSTPKLECAKKTKTLNSARFFFQCQMTWVRVQPARRVERQRTEVAKIVKTMQCNLLSGFSSFSSAMRTSNFFLPLVANVEHVKSMVVEKLSHASEFLSFIGFFLSLSSLRCRKLNMENKVDENMQFVVAQKNIHRNDRSNYKLF